MNANLTESLKKSSYLGSWMLRQIRCKSRLIILLIIGTIFTLSCSSSDESGSSSSGSPNGSSTGPELKVTYTYPPANGRFISGKSSIVVIFDQNVDTSSLTSSTFTLLDASGDQVIASIMVSEKKAILTPTSDLSPDSTYSATLTTGAKASEGGSLGTSFSWNFSTSADVSYVTGGGWHTLEAKPDGTVFAFGWGASGQLGNNAWSSSATPVQVTGTGGSGVLTDVIQVAAGDEHSLALKSDGTVWAWGYGTNGELGNGATSSSPYPVQVVGPGGQGFLTGIVAVTADYYNSLALRNDGTVWGWGDNYYNTLGDGTYQNSSIPVQVCAAGETVPCQNFLSNVVSIATSLYRSVAVKDDGTIWAWGDGTYGGMGNGTTTDNQVPGQVCSGWDISTDTCSGFFSDAVAVATGLSATVVLKSDGTVWTWGYNWSIGSLGIGTTSSGTHSIPKQVCDTGETAPCGNYLSGIINIATGYWHSAALKSDGTVWTWGYNDFGQLGIGNTSSPSSPVQTLGLTNVKHIAINPYYRTYATVSGNTRYGWGRNSNTEFGIITGQECGSNRYDPCSKLPVELSTPRSGQLVYAFNNGKGYVETTNPSGNLGDDIARGVVLDGSGKILVTGYIDTAVDGYPRPNPPPTNHDMVVARYNTNGTLDVSFDGDGVAIHGNAAGGNQYDEGLAITLDASDNILVTGRSHNGSDYDMVIWRFTSSGSLDTSFNSPNGYVIYSSGNGDEYGSDIRMVPDGSGKILVSGQTTQSGGTSSTYRDLAVWRYTADGTLDTSFGGGDGIFTYDGGSGFDSANGFSFDGTTIVVAGTTDSGGANQDLLLLRLDADGALDTSFSGDGIVTHHSAAGGDGNDYGTAVLVTASSEYLIPGYSEGSGTNYDMALWKYTSSGVLDTSFGSSGIVSQDNAAGGTSGIDQAFGATFDASDNILMTGRSYNGNDYDMIVWRYTSNGTLDSAFNDDGIAVYSSSNIASRDDTESGWAITTDSEGNIFVAGQKQIYNAYYKNITVWKILP